MKATPRTQDPAAEIIALEKEALAMWNAGDPDGFLSLASDDVVYFDPALPRKIVGIEALRDYYEPIRGKMHIESYEMIAPVVRVTAEGAVLMYDYEIRRDYKLFAMHCTEVYRREGSGGWKIIHTHWSFATSKP